MDVSSTGQKICVEDMVELPNDLDLDELEIVGGTSTWICPIPISVGCWNDEDDE